MCCIITVLLFLGPRAAAIVWYLVDPARFNLAFNTFIIPCLGFIFLPWTLLMYLAAWQPVAGVTGFGWVVVGVGMLLDIMTYTGGGKNRNRIPGYPQ
jgi:hypothetical protein